MIHPETEEEIRVTCENIDYHGHTRLPYFMTLQRYIVGRPNLINIPVIPVNQDKSMHWQLGCHFHYLVKDVWVWSFADTYPGRLEIDCSFLSPRNSVKIGDVEKMLPHGLYLHNKYENQKFHSVVRLLPTNNYLQRKNAIVDQNMQIESERLRMQSQMLERQKVVTGIKKPKSVPTSIVSSKFIQKEKMASTGIDKYGKEVSMEALLKQAKEG